MPSSFNQHPAPVICVSSTCRLQNNLKSSVHGKNECVAVECNSIFTPRLRLRSKVLWGFPSEMCLSWGWPTCEHIMSVVLHLAHLHASSDIHDLACMSITNRGCVKQTCIVIT